MRYQLYFDDVSSVIIVDTYNDTIIGKVRNEKVAARLCQKLNRAAKDEKLNNKLH